MDGEDYRTGSADSENGSDNSYVQVSAEDVPESDPSTQDVVESTNIPSIDDSEDIYGDDGEEEQEKTLEQEESPSVPMDTPPPEAFEGGSYIESTEEPADIKPLEPSSRVEEVPKPYIPEVPSFDPTPSVPPKKCVDVPVAKGYLSFLNSLHPFLLYLMYWRNVKLSAVVLGAELVILLTLTLNTLIHTIVLFLLSFLVVSLTYIVSKVVIDSFYNREVKNPFSDYLNKKIALPEDKIMEWTHYAIEHLNQDFNRIARLLLFDNIKASLKFGLALWLLSFVTNHFDVLCLLFIKVILAFGVPPLYERFQPVIDSYLDKGIKIAKDTFCQIKSRIPYLGKSKAD